MFGKTMGNFRKHILVEMVLDGHKVNKRVAKLKGLQYWKFSMYDFIYNHMKVKYPGDKLSGYPKEHPLYS